MANIASLYELVLPYLPGAEIPVVRHHGRRVIRDFLRRSTAWRATLSFPTQIGTESYRFTPVEGEVTSILSVRLDSAGRPLPVVPEAHRHSVPASPGTPRGWHALLPSVVSLYPVPDAVYTVHAEAAMNIPIVEAVADDDTFPDDLFAHYGEDIAAGVIGHMMAMPGKPWTQTQIAATYLARFENRIRTLRATLRDGGQPNVSTMRGPHIAGGR